MDLQPNIINQKPKSSNLVKLLLIISFISLFLTLIIGGYTLYLQRQLLSTNDNFKKLSTQLTALKENSTKQLEGSNEIQSKLNNITTKSGQSTSNPSIGTLSDLSQSIVKIYNISRATLSSGTGTVIDKSGHILTNKHVIEEAGYYDTSSILAICITNNPEQSPTCQYTAEIISIGEGELDLALLKIDKKLETTSNGKFKIMPLTVQPQLKYKSILSEINISPALGSQINVLGYPGVGGDNISLTRGIYSGTVDELFFKTDAKVNSGNSGGAAFDQNNLFLGVPTAVSGGQGNIGYIIKADIVSKFIKENLTQ
jgi:S1-C subfamily serine protease